MEPMSLIMLGLIALLIIMMVRNGRKRREQAAEMQRGLMPGAEVMLQTGIYGTFVKFDEIDENRAVIQSGDSTFVVHRNAIGQIVNPVAEEEADTGHDIAPDDDPTFGERSRSDELPDAPEDPSALDK